MSDLRDSMSSVRMHQSPPRMPIACTICAKAKTKCDRAIPSCSRCISKGLLCEARPTRRLTEAARHAKKASSSYQRWASGPEAKSFSTGGISPSSDLSQHSHNMLYNETMPRGHFTYPAYITTDSLSQSPSTLSSTFDAPFRPASDGSSTGSFTDLSTDMSLRMPMDSAISLPPGNRSCGDAFDMVDSTQNMGAPYVADLSDYTLDAALPVDYGFHYPQTFPSNTGSQLPVLDRFSNVQYAPEQHEYNQSDHRGLELCTSLPSSTISFSNVTAQGTYSSAPAPPLSAPSAPSSEFTWQDKAALFNAHEDLPYFRCNRKSEATSTSIDTRKEYIEGLEITLKDTNTWHAWTPPAISWKVGDPSYKNVVIQPFGANVNELLGSVAQGALNKAKEAYQLSSPSLVTRSSVSGNYVGFKDDSRVNLPSPSTLSFFLQAYMCRFEVYYPMIPARTFSPSQLVESSNKQLASLLLLLLVAAGAVATPTIEARWLSSGLIEACKYSLFDSFTKDTPSNLLFFRSSLLLINLATWSGDQSQMNASIMKMDELIKTIRSSGLLFRRNANILRFDWTLGVEVAWRKWKEGESINRLAYSWVILDQELSFFRDLPPNFSVTELTASLPDSDLLWNAISAEEWSRAVTDTIKDKTTDIKCLPSLYDLFKRLMNDRSLENGPELTPLKLRLLLYPLQALVCHLRQCLECFSTDPHCEQAHRVRTQLDEARLLLQCWYEAAMRTLESLEEFSPILCTSFVLYHLVCLNTTITFPDVEKFARGEIPRDTFFKTFTLSTQTPRDISAIWFHCGQIIRHFRLMPEPNRPLWWPASLYRTALTMWAASLSGGSGHPRIGMDSPPTRINQIFPIDDLPPDHPSITGYLQRNEGIPVLLKRDGTIISLDIPCDTVGHCLDVLNEEESTTRFMDGIKNQLARFFQRIRL